MLFVAQCLILVPAKIATSSTHFSGFPQENPDIITATTKRPLYIYATTTGKNWLLNPPSTPSPEKKKQPTPKKTTRHFFNNLLPC
ncbi:uncharacterized protein LAJ45_11284 [Morchella importuna]|uniref:uncharacterized protein n=1 Tax=Morchella importuna TaxID=1174673 RepID=UPI001E8D3E82|nr:uncharacterized protein LAJ45_11284 [Morchella importuna]KAH8144690.1 hypothetical protein LAJ45_11284 [Morchella importuna]